MTTDPKARRTGFPIGLTIAVAIAFAILIALGSWQLQRLAWKQNVLTQIEALQAAPAQPLAPVLDRVAKGNDADFMRAKVVTARFYADHLLTKAPGLRDSIVEGAECVTALALESF